LDLAPSVARHVQSRNAEDSAPPLVGHCGARRSRTGRRSCAAVREAYVRACARCPGCSPARPRPNDVHPAHSRTQATHAALRAAPAPALHRRLAPACFFALATGVVPDSLCAALGHTCGQPRDLAPLVLAAATDGVRATRLRAPACACLCLPVPACASNLQADGLCIAEQSPSSPHGPACRDLFSTVSLAGALRVPPPLRASCGASCAGHREAHPGSQCRARVESRPAPRRLRCARDRCGCA
jgi:hypothetical protein